MNICTFKCGHMCSGRSIGELSAHARHARLPQCSARVPSVCHRRAAGTLHRWDGSSSCGNPEARQGFLFARLAKYSVLYGYVYPLPLRDPNRTIQLSYNTTWTSISLYSTNVALRRYTYMFMFMYCTVLSMLYSTLHWKLMYIVL